MVSTLFGKAPKVQSTAPKEITDEKDDSKKRRRNQFLTEGQVTGEELNVGSVGGKPTLFGN